MRELKLFLGWWLPFVALLADCIGNGRHEKALAAELAATDVDTTPWYDRDPVLAAMSANRLGVAVKMWPIWALLAIFGLLAFRVAGPGCCPDTASWVVFPVHDFPPGPLPWIAFIGYMTGVGGVIICPLLIAVRARERRAARRLRSLVATPSSPTPMWLALFRKTQEVYVESVGTQTVVSGWAVLWPTKPTLGIGTLPSDPVHRQAVVVRLLDRHTLPCPDNRWCAPEPVTVVGKPVAGEWIVIRAAGATYWPARRVESNTTWRRFYRKAYKISYGLARGQREPQPPRNNARS